MDKYYRRYVEFICKCNTIKWSRLDSIKSGKIKSCGCRMHEKECKHGLCDHSIYRIWDNIKQRCTNEKSDAWPDYGGRGILLCDEWYSNPEKFIQWSIENGWEKGLTIERKDNNLGYSPDNCIWATRYEQSRNKRNSVFLTAFGETKCIADWYNDERCIVSKNQIAYRINKMGWDAEKAMTVKGSTPNRKNGRFVNGIISN